MSENNINTTNNFVPPPPMDYELPPEDRFAKEVSPYNKGAVFGLAFFLGMVGIHNFYTGNKKRGLIMLLCTLSGILTPVSGVLWIIDMAKILNNNFTDGNGRTVK